MDLSRAVGGSTCGILLSSVKIPLDSAAAAVSLPLVVGDQTHGRAGISPCVPWQRVTSSFSPHPVLALNRGTDWNLKRLTNEHILRWQWWLLSAEYSRWPASAVS